MRTNAKLRAQIHALGDPTRLAIFERLGDGPLAVVDIAKGLPVTRPAVSQHLKILKHVGLITSQRAGNRSLYRLDPEGVNSMRGFFDRFWLDALQSFKAAAEQSRKAT